MLQQRNMLHVTALLFVLLASNGHAQRGAEAATSPFSGLTGGWSGNGIVTLQGGAKERLRCRAAYVFDGGNDSLQQSLRCASDSYRFELKSDVFHHNGTITGRWEETTRRVFGNLTGQARDDQIDVRIESPTFTALLYLSTRGDRQRVTIRSPGSRLEEVSITLHRSR